MGECVFARVFVAAGITAHTQIHSPPHTPHMHAGTGGKTKQPRPITNPLV